MRLTKGRYLIECREDAVLRNVQFITDEIVELEGSDGPYEVANIHITPLGKDGKPSYGPIELTEPK